MSHPSLGVAAIILHQQQCLFGHRVSEQPHCWQLPGGLIEMGETPNQAIYREVFEETNLEIEQEQIISITNNIFSPDQHSISIIFTAICKNPTKLTVMEPNKCSNWQWIDWDQLPQPLFLPLQHLVDSGYDPFKHKKTTNLGKNTKHCFIF